MARCPHCGRRAAFGAGRAVVPALETVQDALEMLREVIDSGELNKEVRNPEGVLAAGEELQRQLHTAAHNMTAVRIDWPAVQRWLDITAAATRAAPIIESLRRMRRGH
jgi:hypothetical protein